MPLINCKIELTFRNAIKYKRAGKDVVRAGRGYNNMDYIDKIFPIFPTKFFRF